MKLHVVFSLSGAEYALPFDSVLQMESYEGATLVPGAPDYVDGIVTVRGLVVPVLDLRTRFGLPRAELNLDTRIIVTECQGRIVALRVDTAREVLKLEVDKNQPAPSVVSERSSGFVYAVHPLGKRLLLLIDLPKLLGEDSHDPKPRALPEDDGSSTRPQLPS
ncbi:MAG TPA: chemotaxis protein CheW [Polyangiaceae bacterium]|nr:chemotaxis protein CheW [Polyangiaceae bacterium]